MANFKKRLSDRKGVIVATAFITGSLCVAAISANAGIQEKENTKWEGIATEAQACVAVFNESQQLFSALDGYLFSDGASEHRSNVADAIDAHSPFAEVIPANADGSKTARLAENIDSAVAGLDSEVFRGELSQVDPDSALGNEWLALSTVGIEQEELIIHCALEGISLDANYNPYLSESTDLTESVEEF